MNIVLARQLPAIQHIFFCGWINILITIIMTGSCCIYIARHNQVGLNPGPLCLETRALTTSSKLLSVPSPTSPKPSPASPKPSQVGHRGVTVQSQGVTGFFMYNILQEKYNNYFNCRNISIICHAFCRIFCRKVMKLLKLPQLGKE